jgi:hypothetical protein
MTMQPPDLDDLEPDPSDYEPDETGLDLASLSEPVRDLLESLVMDVDIPDTVDTLTPVLHLDDRARLDLAAWLGAAQAHEIDFTVAGVVAARRQDFIGFDDLFGHRPLGVSYPSPQSEPGVG